MSEIQNPKSLNLPPELLPPPFEQIITFADGSVIKGSGAETPDKNLWLWIDKSVFSSLREALIYLDDPNKLSTIRVDYSAISHVEFTGYTKIMDIKLDLDGKFSVQLNQEAG